MRITPTRLALVALALTAGPAFAQAPAGADVAAFVGELSRACARGDKVAMAGLVQYPLSVSTSGMRIPIANRDALLKSYEAVFTPGVCQAVAAAQAGLKGGGDAAALKPTANGVAIGGNVLEASRVGGALKVVRISAAAAPGAGGATGTAYKLRTNERLIPRPGRPMPVRGALAQGQRESFIVNVQQGQLLSVRLAEVKGDEVTATIVEADSGEPVDARAGGGVRAWNGRVKKSGDYRIQVARTGGAGETLGYTVTVEVK
jgi:hypothetical protein